MSPDLIPAVPAPAALLRDFVNTFDHELHTDELATAAGLTAFLRSHGLLEAGVADERQREQAVALRTGLHHALELNHDDRHSPLAALDRVLAGLAVRLHWSGDGVVVVASDHGVVGRPGPDRSGGARGAGVRGLVAAEDLRVRRVRAGPTTTIPRTGRATTASTAAATSSRRAPTVRVAAPRPRLTATDRHHVDSAMYRYTDISLCGFVDNSTFVQVSRLDRAVDAGCADP